MSCDPLHHRIEVIAGLRTVRLKVRNGGSERENREMGKLLEKNKNRGKIEGGKVHEVEEKDRSMLARC